MISQDIYELPNVQTKLLETYAVHRIRQEIQNFHELLNISIQMKNPGTKICLIF